MGDTTKTKAAMLNELESIKGLLLAADDIPILQEEVLEQSPALHAAHRLHTEEQQDFFTGHNHSDNRSDSHKDSHKDSHSASEHHNLHQQLHPHTPDSHKSSERPALAKALGENPFLPEHIRARLHGNNPPPLFAAETAQNIARSSSPSRQLGNTFGAAGSLRTQQQQEIIDSIIAKMLPEIEQELRARLALMSKTLLDELQR